MRRRTFLAWPLLLAWLGAALLSLAGLAGPASGQASPCPPGQPPGRPPGQPAGRPPGQPETRPPAYPPGKCQLRLSRSAGAAGEGVVASGDGFAPGSVVALSIGSQQLEEVRTDGNGSFTEEVVIPSGTDPGTYQITAAGAAPGGEPMELAATYTVTDPQRASPARASRQSAGPLGNLLARTGSNTVPLAAVGVGLVAVGTVAVVSVRRRRRMLID